MGWETANHYGGDSTLPTRLSHGLFQGLLELTFHVHAPEALVELKLCED